MFGNGSRSASISQMEPQGMINIYICIIFGGKKDIFLFLAGKFRYFLKNIFFYVIFVPQVRRRNMAKRDCEYFINQVWIAKYGRDDAINMELAVCDIILCVFLSFFVFL